MQIEVVDILYTPYGLQIQIENVPDTNFNSLTLKLSADKNYFKIIKDNFLDSYKSHQGLHKLKEKLKEYHMQNFIIKEIDGVILSIYIEVPVRSKLHKTIDTMYKVARLISEILLKKFPRRIENKMGLNDLLNLYNELEVKMVLYGNSNIIKVFRLLRKITPYIGFRY